MGTIRVVLAEDHALMRDAVKLVLEEEEDVVLVGEVANGNELLPLLKRVEADFVLLHVQLPGLDGLACLEALAEHHPQVKVAMLSAVEDTNVIESAFRRGADGYIHKAVNPFDLPAAIRQIVDQSVIHRPLTPRDGVSSPPPRGRALALGEGSRRARRALPRPHEQADRCAALAERADGEVPPAQHLPQARDQKPGPRRSATPTSTTSRRCWPPPPSAQTSTSPAAQAEPRALAGGELEHGSRSLRGRHPPRPKRRRDRDDAPLAVEEDDVDREAHEVRVHGARPRQEQAAFRRMFLGHSHQAAEARCERRRDTRAADETSVGPRQVHVVGHGEDCRLPSQREGDPKGWSRSTPSRCGASRADRLNGRCQAV